MIELEINGMVHVIEGMDSLAGALESDKDAMYLIMQAGRESTALNFQVGGRPNPWERLAPATMARRLDEGIMSYDPLVATGETMESFMGGGNLYTIAEFDDHFAEWGNARPDFAGHDQGTFREPQRQVLIHQDEDILKYTDIYVAFLEDAINMGEV